ncbi:solute carrier family 49 member A3 [Platichthys flesus]|uniref:solute carrier family 49 member A3 n=1 Tax=Platichthys flesus TaxID=8260 RepID=UPI002DBB6424|nr:solute carrier family 49 member A3 [Platichthys flesus]
MEETGAGTNGGEALSSSSSSSCDVPREPNLELKKLLFFKVYKRRWFVLLILCLLNCSNATIWLTFAPVADQSAHYLGVTLVGINWLSLIYMVVAIPLSLCTTWMLDILGLRITMILGAWLNMFGALLRFIATVAGKQSSSLVFSLVMVGQTLGAIAQPLIIFTPTKLAALWFPDHQRATANMIGTMSNPLGILLANVISPLLAQTSAQIPMLLLVYATPACFICFLATVGIRSSAPPTPPSASAESSASEPYVQGVKLLMKNRPYLVLLVCFGSGIGVFTSFSTLLEQILCVQGYTNDFAGLCGALFIVFGIVGAGALGPYVDKSKKFIEATKIPMSLTALCFIAFSVVSLMREQKVALAVVCSLCGFFGFSIYPVVMELSVECSYPVGEATSAGLVFVSGQVQSVLYIVILQALTKRIAASPLSTCGDAVLSWKVPMLVMAGLCSFFSCCFVILFNTRYRRLEAEMEATYGTKRTSDPAHSVETSDPAHSVETSGHAKSVETSDPAHSMETSGHTYSVETSGHAHSVMKSDPAHCVETSDPAHCVETSDHIKSEATSDPSQSVETSENKIL